MHKPIKVVDLFAGAGGFSQGFLMVKSKNNTPVFEVIKAVELDETFCKTLKSHLKKQNINVEDVVLNGNLESEKIKKQVINECKGAEVIIGGPPCQTFSLASPARCGSNELREKLKDDNRNRLYKHYIDIVSGISPSFVVFENVEGMISKKIIEESSGEEKYIIDIIIKDLNKLGYNTKVEINGTNKDFLILNAADYGVPQIRKRVFIIGNKLKISNPVPTKLFKEGTEGRFKTIGDTISHLPVVLPVINTTRFNNIKKIDEIANNPEKYVKPFINTIVKLKDKFLNRIDEIEKFNYLILVLNDKYKKLKQKQDKLLALREFVDSYNQSLAGLNGKVYDQSSYPALHICRPHNIRDVCIFSLMKAGTSSANFLNKESKFYDPYLAKIYPYGTENHRDTYVKQDMNSPSTTILSHMNRDGLRFIHPEQPRTFTPCEAALLQSFSYTSKFSGKQSDMFVQIGNAVPPLLAKAIGEGIYSALNNF